MDDENPKTDPKLEAAWLLFNEETQSTAGKPPVPTPGAGGSGSGYAIEVTEGEPAVPSPAPPVERHPKRASSAPPNEPTPRRRRRAESSGVDQVWTRGAEWGSSLVTLGVGLMGVGLLLYATFNPDALFLWVMIFLGSIVALALLAYPIFITLERPVRVTPEQAVKDFFGAFSHLVPHYKRMWLLLAVDGRVSAQFRSFEEFRGYWKAKVAGWKREAGGSGSLNPFDVEVIEFTAGKSAGETEVEASYTARVVRRGELGGAPIASRRVALRLVRGPDKMWYLEHGSLE